MLFTEKITPRKIKIMLVDDSAILLREAVPFLLQHPNLELVGTVYHTATAVAQAQTLKPDVVLLDVTIRGMHALYVIPQLRAVNPSLGVIVLDEIEVEAVKRAAVAGGAAAFVPKQKVETHLLPAIFAITESNPLDA